MARFRKLNLQKAEQSAPDRITLTWGDGRVNRHGYRDLRLACQCASCRDEMTGRRLLDPAAIPPDIHPTRIDPVGSYALRFVWSDGHDTGMFPYDFLYQGGETLAKSTDEV